jgi:hypothetical protein
MSRYSSGVPNEPVTFLALFVAACGAPVAPTTPPTQPAPAEVTVAPIATESACSFDLAAALAIADASSQRSDFFPAVRDCVDLAEWTAAFNANGGGPGTGRDAIEILRNLCLDPEVANEPLCESVPPAPS